MSKKKTNNAEVPIGDVFQLNLTTAEKSLLFEYVSELEAWWDHPGADSFFAPVCLAIATGRFTVEEAGSLFAIKRFQMNKLEALEDVILGHDGRGRLLKQWVIVYDALEPLFDWLGTCYEKEEKKQKKSKHKKVTASKRRRAEAS